MVDTTPPRTTGQVWQIKHLRDGRSHSHHHHNYRRIRLLFRISPILLRFPTPTRNGLPNNSLGRIFMSAFFSISVWLILFPFFPYLETEMAADQQFQHEFALNSLTITEFQASKAHVTGKCDITLNIANNGERSIYHETSVLSIFMDHELLGVRREEDFFMDIGNSIMFNVSISKTTISVPAAFVPTAMIESQKLNKTLRFKVKYDGMLCEGLAAWYEERWHVYIVCGWIEMRFINDTTLMGRPANCSLENY